jgi:two-component system nitrogen regulation response regulator GlnG/two-component system response regulator HydG
LALVLLWSQNEGQRIGEVLWMPQTVREKAVVLGRDSSRVEDGERFGVFERQRPGVNQVTTQLIDPGISRRQARFVCERAGILTVDPIGGTPMAVNGRVLSEPTVITEGDLITIGQAALLRVSKRVELIPELPDFPDDALGAFGEPDAFGITGESPATWRLRAQICFLARRAGHGLILGESGTGKELAARALHALSSRAEGPFVARNAATIPEGLVAVELFGNAKNYPNPGMAERSGLVGQSDGGTLFLDEIGELPEGAQANLLRVLDTDGEYQRLGESKTRVAKFRLLSATNRDEHSLKHDLRARFVHVLRIPSLAERIDDLSMVARSLLIRIGEGDPEIGGQIEAISGKLSTGVLPISCILAEALMAHDYNLNIRELERVLWTAIGSAGGGLLDLTDDVAVLLGEAETTGGSETAPAESDIDAATVLEAIARHRGNKSLAAEELGLSSRFALYRLIKRLNLDV